MKGVLLGVETSSLVALFVVIVPDGDGDIYPFPRLPDRRCTDGSVAGRDPADFTELREGGFPCV